MLAVAVIAFHSVIFSFDPCTAGSAKYEKCRLHDRSSVDLCCTDRPSLTLSSVASAAKCASLCFAYEGRTKPPVSSEGGTIRADASRNVSTGAPFGTTRPEPLPYDGWLSSPRDSCVSFNFKPESRSCELFDGRNKFEVVRGYRHCAFYQKRRSPSHTFWLNEFHDCADIPASKPEDSGIYWITVGDLAHAVNCEITVEKRIYTIIHRRMSGLLDFRRNWRDYADGFGDLRQEFWMGTDLMNLLTSRSLNYTLRIELNLLDGEDPLYAEYTDFSIASIEDDFTIRFGKYSGTAGDALGYHNGMKFSSIERDNDLSAGYDCGALLRSGWWYKSCRLCDLNGPYCSDTSRCANWMSYNLGWKFVQMKIFRNDSIVKTVDPFGPISK